MYSLLRRDCSVLSDEGVQFETARVFNSTDIFINRTMFRAVRRRKETVNKLLDFNEAIQGSEIPEIVDTLLRMKEQQFTISSEFSGLIGTLKEFEKYDAHIVSLTEVNSIHKDLETDEHERIPALLMELK